MSRRELEDLVGELTQRVAELEERVAQLEEPAAPEVSVLELEHRELVARLAQERGE